MNSPDVRTGHYLRTHGSVLVAYALLSILLTWPLLRYVNSHVPGNGIDDPALAWNLWWIKTRLVEQLNPDIFHVGWMFHPIDINLAFYTLTPLNGLLSLPFQFSVGLIVASNLILLSSYLLSGYGAFLLCRYLLPITGLSATGDKRGLWIACLFGGLIYAFSSAKLFYAALGQFNIASSQWIPFFLLYLLRTFEQTLNRRRMRNLFMAALFLTLQAWSELTYASFLIIFAVLYCGWLIIVRRGNSSLANMVYLLWPFVALALVFAIGISPFLFAMIPDMSLEGDFFGSGGGFATWFSADLVGYLLPTRLHPLLGSWVGNLHAEGFSNDVGQHIYLGYSVMLLCFIALWQLLRGSDPAHRYLGWLWGGALLLFWLLTLGPAPQWFGQPLWLPGPFALVSKLPFFSGNRYPSRYSVMLLITVAPLAAYGLWWLLARLGDKSDRAVRHGQIGHVMSASFGARQAIIASIVIGIFILEHLSIPLPLNRSLTPPIFDRIARTPGDFAILELPTGWRNGAYVLGKSDKLIMMQQWYQTVHGKRRLGGNTSRNPWYKFEYFVNAPLLGDLITLMNGDKDYIAQEIDGKLDQMIARNRPIAPAVLEFLDVKFVTLTVEKSPPALRRFVDEALPLTRVAEWSGEDWSGSPQTIQLYAVNADSATASNAWTLATEDEMSPLTTLHMAEGWASLTAENGVRYARRKQAGLLLDLPPESETISVDWVGTSLSASMNSRLLRPLGERSHSSSSGGEQWKTTEFAIPADLASEPVDRMQLFFDGPPVSGGQLPQPPSELGWPIGSTGRYLHEACSIVVMSAGFDSGKFARIFVNGDEVISAERGYIFAALSLNGEVLDARHFDTIASIESSAQMATWLRSWSAGTILAGAVADAVDTLEGTMLSAGAVEALRYFGVAEDMRGRHRWGHAFVGAAATSPGSALEEVRLTGILTLAVGTPLQSPTTPGGLIGVSLGARRLSLDTGDASSD